MELGHEHPDYQAFTQAIEAGQVNEVEQYLITHPEFLDSPDAEGLTPLHRACSHDHSYNVVKLLLQRGSQSINSRSVYGMIPLHYTFSRKDISAVKLILHAAKKMGISCLDSPTINGNTPLHLAAIYGNNLAIELFLRKGSISINSLNHRGETPLHIAALNGYDSTIELLLEHGGNSSIDSRSNEGNTPLHHAALHGFDSTVELLLRKSSHSLDCSNNDGRTPLYFAGLRGHKSIVRILRAAGATIPIFDHSEFDNFDPDLPQLQQLQLPQLWQITAMLQEVIPEEEILEIRSRIYFNESLFSRLLGFV